MATRILILSFLALTSSGCASVQDFSYNQSHRLQAYCGSIGNGNFGILNRDYTDGWREGYYDFSTGRRCKPPVVPPHCYWGASYQSPNGQQAIAEWYQGYEKGLICAEKDCGNCFHQIRPRIDGVPGPTTVTSHSDLPIQVPSSISNDAPIPLPILTEESGEWLPLPSAPAKPTFAPPPIN